MKKLTELAIGYSMGGGVIKAVQGDHLTRGVTFVTEAGISSVLTLVKDSKVYEIEGTTKEEDGKLRHELVLTNAQTADTGIYQAQITLKKGEEVQSTKEFSVYITRDISLDYPSITEPSFDWIALKDSARDIARLREEIDDIVMAGGQVDKAYIHEQIEAKATWEISHPLSKHPSVTVIDSGGSVVVGDVKYIDNSKLIVTFSAEFSGKAYLN